MKKRLGVESLEHRRMMAIVWANESDTTLSGFRAGLPESVVTAESEMSMRAVVKRAIADWNSVVLDQDIDNDNNPSTGANFPLTVRLAQLATGVRGFADGNPPLQHFLSECVAVVAVEEEPEAVLWCDS
ncbi:MAG: hypothetical protein ACRCT8_01085 [Lacipirellulaceae bacterium]